MFKRIISFVLAFVICFMLCVPAFASNQDEYHSTVTGFWDYIGHCAAQSDTGIPFVDTFLQLEGAWGSRLWGNDNICRVAPGGLHIGSAWKIEDYKGSHIGTGIHDGAKTVYCRCSYCGESFSTIVYDEDFAEVSAAYDDFVETLPSTSITSSGGLVYPIPMYLEGYSSDISLVSISPDDSNPFSAVCVLNRSSRSVIMVKCRTFVIPVSGTYTGQLVSECSSFCDFEADNSGFFDSNYFAAGTSLAYWQVPVIRFVVNSHALQQRSSFTCSARFVIEPDNALDVSGGDTYNIDNRPSTINGDFGIIGENNEISVVGDTYFFNETTNTYNNPSTDTQKTVQDWSYDYSNRSYTLNLGNGDTSTVTYGDESVTVVENSGNTTNTYTYYYIINSGSDEPETPPPAHTHEYTSAVTTPATCITPGVETFTCSQCGNSYTSTIPARGHTWAVKETVLTEYDENGELVQQGYTIYKCSVCGEEYRADSGTQPPSGGSGGSGSISGGSGIFKIIFEIVVDFFSFFLDFFRGFVVGGIKGFLGNIKDGAGDIFSILNPVNWFD